MNEQEFDRKLAHFVGAINATPDASSDLPAASAPLVEMARARYETLRNTAAALQESLDSLRVSVKYLVFDLEATRRENAELREELAKLRKGSDGDAAKG